MIISYNYNNYTSIIKYIFLIIFYPNVIFFDFIFISIEKKELIEIDNELKLNPYENENIIIKFQANFKAIALYYPEYNKISNFKYFNKCSNSVSQKTWNL